MVYRYYSDTAPTVKLFASMDASVTQMVLTASLAAYLPSFPFVLRVEPDTANEELMLVQSGGGVVGNPYVVIRAYGTTTAKSHAANSDVQHGVSSVDLKDARDHEATGTPAIGATGPHGLPWSAWGSSVDVSVRDFGAKGDGTTDDTVAIQAALAATGWPVKSGAVYFPPGRYKITAETLIDGGSLVATPDLVFYGAGAEIFTTTPGINVFRITNTLANGTTFVKFRNLTFFTNATGSTSIAMNNTEGIAVEGCWFIGGGHTAIVMTGQNWFNRIQDSFFSDCARGIYLNGDCSWLTVTNCQFTEQLNGSPALNWIEGAVGSNFVKISDCIFYGTGATLPIVRVTAGFQWIISGCSFNECDQEGIMLGYFGTTYRHLITGNTFHNMKKDYIHSMGSEHVVVSNNVFGAYLAGTANTYSNVRVEDPFGSNGGSFWVVTGNVSTESAANLDQSVKFDATCLKSIITSNYGAAGFTAAGAGCVLANNVT